MTNKKVTFVLQLCLKNDSALKMYLSMSRFILLRSIDIDSIKVIFIVFNELGKGSKNKLIIFAEFCREWGGKCPYPWR